MFYFAEIRQAGRDNRARPQVLRRSGTAEVAVLDFVSSLALAVRIAGQMNLGPSREGIPNISGPTLRSFSTPKANAITHSILEVAC